MKYFVVNYLVEYNKHLYPSDMVLKNVYSYYILTTTHQSTTGHDLHIYEKKSHKTVDITQHPMPSVLNNFAHQ